MTESSLEFLYELINSWYFWKLQLQKCRFLASQMGYRFIKLSFHFPCLCVALLLLLFWDMYLFCEADTARAVRLLKQYQANLTSPEEQALKTSVGKVSSILGSQLFQALLGKLVLKKRVFRNFSLYLMLHQTVLRMSFPNNASSSRACLLKYGRYFFFRDLF